MMYTQLVALAVQSERDSAHVRHYRHLGTNDNQGD